MVPILRLPCFSNVAATAPASGAVGAGLRRADCVNPMRPFSIQATGTPRSQGAGDGCLHQHDAPDCECHPL